MSAEVLTDDVTPLRVSFTVAVAAEAGVAVVMNPAVSAAVAMPTEPTLATLLIVCGDVRRPAVRETNMQLQTSLVRAGAQHNGESRWV